MALWLVRAGGHGEFEQKFLNDNRIYLTWDGLNHNLAKLADKAALLDVLRQVYPQFTKNHLYNNRGQVWAFARRMQPGDWVVCPSKSRPAIAVGEITGPYKYDGDAKDPYYHSRTVKWLNHEVPRSNFGQDLLYSLGSLLTVCEVSRNDAEKRVRAMAAGGWKPEPATVALTIGPEAEEGDAETSADGGVDL